MHYNEANSFLFVTSTEIHKVTVKDSMIVPYSLCLRRFLKIFQHVTRKKLGFIVYVNDFSVDYNAIDVDNIKDICKYLMKKNGIVLKCSDL